MQTIKTRAAVVEGPDLPFAIHDVELDTPRDDEVLVRIAGVGICHTDLVFKSEGLIKAPVVLGHEGAGVVEAVGAKVTKVAVGDKVVISFRTCGTCSSCVAGVCAYCQEWPTLNLTGMRPDGSMTLKMNGTPVGGSFFGQSSFAAHALAYERNLVKVPEDLPFEIMGPLGCGIQTGAGGVMRSLACRAGSSLVITGGGAVGLSGLMGAVIQGCGTVIVVEPHYQRRALALELGATHVIDPGERHDIVAAIREIVPNGVDYAFDTTGLPSLQLALTDALAPMAVFGFVGMAPPGTSFPGDMTKMMLLGVTFKGIIQGDSEPDLFIPELISHYRNGRFPFDRLITTFEFDQINEAIEAQQRGECIKIVLLAS